MIRNAIDKRSRSVHSNPVYAEDGEVGRIADVLFDDRSWTVRYLVVDTGGGLAGRRALITPEFVSGADRQAKVLYVKMSRERAYNAPGIEADLPVASQREVEYYNYFGASPYWDAAWGPVVAGPPATAGNEPGVREGSHGGGDPHLRSAGEVVGYHIEASDDSVGHVEDLLVDDESWQIRYVAVDTRNWLPGKKVLVPPQWITGVNWPRQRIHVDLVSEEIEGAPGWDPEAPIDRDYEIRLHEHYGRPPYWAYE